MLLKCWSPYVSKFGKPSSGHKTGKSQSSSQFSRTAVQMNVQTTRQSQSFPMLVSVHISLKVMLKIIQARLQQLVNQELPDIKARFQKGRRTRDQIVNIGWIMEKARMLQEKKKKETTSTSASSATLKTSTVWITRNCGKLLKKGERESTRLPYLSPLCGSWNSIRTVHGTDWFKIGKGLWHPAYLTYMERCCCCSR